MMSVQRKASFSFMKRNVASVYRYVYIQVYLVSVETVVSTKNQASLVRSKS